MTDIVYSYVNQAQNNQRHILAVMVDNESGVLARVVGLFSGRGYNIESLTVAEVDEKEKISRITIVTSGDEAIITQIKAQLERIVPVHSVYDLSTECVPVERELGLVKVRGDKALLKKAHATAIKLGAQVVDATDQSYVFEFTGTELEIDGFIKTMQPLGLINIARTGVVAVSRGAVNLRDLRKLKSKATG